PARGRKVVGGPCATSLRKAVRVSARGRGKYEGPSRQYMHQHPLQAPFLLKRSSRAGHRSGVSGRTVNFMQPSLGRRTTLALSDGRRAKQGGTRKKAKRAGGRPLERVVGRHPPEQGLLAASC